MRRPLLLVAAVGLLLGACGADGNDGTASGDAAAATSAAGGSLANDAAPDALRFVAPQVGGGSIDMSQYAGTTVALWFWAPT